MKKLYTTPDYKSWHKRRIVKSSRGSSNATIPLQIFNNRKKNKKRKYGHWKTENINKLNTYRKPFYIPIDAPADFRLFDNPNDCLEFFRSIRDSKNVNYVGNFKFIKISLRSVERIDYATISALTAISDDLKFRGITLQGNFPKNIDCQKFIADSGFLNHMFDERNHRFLKAAKSDLIFFEKGCGTLSLNDNIKISQVIKDVLQHLTGAAKFCPPIKTVLLEICGNSIEHASTQNRQWLLGIKFEDSKVVFTVTDVGKGILETLHRRFGRVVADVYKNRDNLDILKRAFRQKYGSSTKEVNRNKGLPAVKASSDSGIISNLKVLTNNVILDFKNGDVSRTFEEGAPRFRGTIYQWEMDTMCIEKMNSTSL